MITDPILDLLQRHYAGDKTALDALLAEVLPWLHAEVRRALAQRPRETQDSMDLVQTTILNFLAWGPRFQPRDGAQFRALLRRIALNELIDHHRRAVRLQKQGVAEAFASASNPLSGFAAASLSSLRPSRAAEKREEAEWVRLALQFLASEDRELVLLSEVEGLEWTAIAQQLELPSPAAARVRAARLMPKLGNLLRQLKAGLLPPMLAE